MLTEKDAALIYETILASPGMSDEVKVPLKIPGKNVLILAKVIKLELSAKNANDSDGIFSGYSHDADQLLELVPHLL